MSSRREPDDVDLFLGGVEPDVEADRETARFIKEYKERPGYPAELDEAEKILASLGIHPSDHGAPDAAELLNQWRTCVADLTKPAPGTRLESAKTKGK